MLKPLMRVITGKHNTGCYNTVRCAWVPVAMSHRVGRLRSTLPEARSGQCLSVVDSPRACLSGGLSLWPGSMREVGGADRW
jgi:hypothetical protein